MILLSISNQITFENQLNIHCNYCNSKQSITVRKIYILIDPNKLDKRGQELSNRKNDLPHTEHLAYISLEKATRLHHVFLVCKHSANQIGRMLKKGTCASMGPLPHNDISACSTNLLLLRYLNGLAFHCCMKNNKH